MHPILAIRAFFLILFGRPLPIEIFPPMMLPEPPKRKEPDPVEPLRAEPAKVEPAKVEPPKAPEAKGPPPETLAVASLAVLQSEGRLLDFLSENIDAYSDADIGAAVREVHRGCNKAIRDHFKLVPVRAEDEEAMITVPDGYDPAEIRLVGNVVGKPPFSGTLKHRGWRIEEVRLPKSHGMVVTPAEVEV
jgi:hypothetical protein